MTKHLQATQIGLALALLALISLTSVALAQPAGQGTTQPGVAAYDLYWWTVDGGGGSSNSGGGYTLSATAGQHDAAVWGGDGYTLYGGFWGRGAVQHVVYLPLVVTGVDPWEQEPNDTSAQANGPILSDLIYYGTMPAGDGNDYFYFDSSTAGAAELWLTQIPAGCNYDLVLRNTTLAVVGYSANLGNANEHILASTLPTGRYYIQVYHNSASGSSQLYHLRVNYP